MRERIICPFHLESTPSCVLYADGYHCFGCGKTGRLEELGLKPKNRGTEKYVENVVETISRIRDLPCRLVRGLLLPTDSNFYYVVWPGGEYYKRRAFRDSPGVPKYKGPSGVPKPLFQAQTGRGKTLIAIEGELNALSVAVAFPDVDVVSPGGAGDFVSHRFRFDRDFYTRYDKILIVGDKDKAGACAAIDLKANLSGIVRASVILLMEPDANDILVNHGKEKIREEINPSLEVLARL